MMKNTIKTMLGLSLALAPLSVTAQTAPAPAAAEAAATPSPAEVKEAVSYFLGYQFGNQIAQGAPGLTVDDLDKDAFFRAVADGLRNQVDPKMRENAPACLDAFSAELEERAAKTGAENKAKGEAFLAENAKKDGVVTTKSGLQYKVLKDADGRKYSEEKDGSNAIASVIYEGRLIDGTVFDGSEEPVEFPINQVIPGFTEALKLMPIGAEWEIYIPSDLAYGENGPGVIGNNATLIFKMKLTDIQPAGTSSSPIQLTPELMQQLQEQGLEVVE